MATRRFQQDDPRGGAGFTPTRPVPTATPEEETVRSPLGFSSTEDSSKAGYLRTWARGGMGPPLRSRIKYFSGDEWKPANTPGIVADIQSMLVSAGLLDPEKLRIGLWDQTSAEAYREVLAYANRVGLSANEALVQLAQNPSAATTKALSGGGKEAPILQLTNPAELREAFRSAYQNRVGMDPPPAAMDAFVNQYHSIERSAGKALNDAQPGATVTQPMSPGTAAEEEIRRNHDAEEHAYQTITRMNDFFSMLDSPV